MSKSKVEIATLIENLAAKKTGLKKQEDELDSLLKGNQEKKQDELESRLRSPGLDKANNEALGVLKRERNNLEESYKALKPVEARRDELTLKIKELQADVKRLEQLNEDQLVGLANESPRSKS